MTLNGSLAWKLTIWFLLLSFFPIMVMAVFVRQNVADAIEDVVASETRSRVMLLAREIAGKHKRVSNQYRVTYAPPDGASDQPVMSILTSRQGLGLIPTLDGNVP